MITPGKGKSLLWGCCLVTGIFFWKPGACQAEPTAAAKIQVVADYGRLPLHFIENRGQVDPRVRYYVKQGGGTVFFTDREVVLALPQAELHRP